MVPTGIRVQLLYRLVAPTRNRPRCQPNWTHSTPMAAHRVTSDPFHPSWCPTGHDNCCDLPLTALTCTMALVTTMGQVTTSGRSGHASNFALVRRIGRVVHHQPDPVGVGSARRMPNKLRKMRTCHRRGDRLCGATRQNLRGTHTPTRTTLIFPADRPIRTYLGSRDGMSASVRPLSWPKTLLIADQNTTVEFPYLFCISR